MVLGLEDQTLPFEPVRLPRIQVLLRLALELVGLVLAVGDEQGRGRVRDVEDGAVSEDLIAPQLELRLQEGVGEGREVVEAADGGGALYDVAGQPVLALPVGREQHGDEVARRRSGRRRGCAPGRRRSSAAFS